VEGQLAKTAYYVIRVA